MVEQLNKRRVSHQLGWAVAFVSFSSSGQIGPEYGRPIYLIRFDAIWVSNGPSSEVGPLQLWWAIDVGAPKTGPQSSGAFFVLVLADFVRQIQSHVSEI